MDASTTCSHGNLWTEGCFSCWREQYDKAIGDLKALMSRLYAIRSDLRRALELGGEKLATADMIALISDVLEESAPH